MNAKIVTKEVSGIASALIDMRKPMYSKNDSEFGENPDGTIYLKGIGEDDKRLAKQLANCKGGSGHDSFLKDIVVHMDITATADFILQLYRYHFRDTSSSESKMHCIIKQGDIGDRCSEWVSDATKEVVNNLIEFYNLWCEEGLTAYTEGLLIGLSEYWGLAPYPTTKEELFECIVHNTPLGYMLTFGEVTNYLQLKAQYRQRKNHKMPMWNTVFKEWVEGLPMSYLITGMED